MSPSFGKRDFSRHLEAALALWALNDRDGARRLWTEADEALSSHKGPGEAASWLLGACHLEPMLQDMIDAGVKDLSDVLTDSWNCDYAWMESPAVCEWIAERRPGFLSGLVADGFDEEALYGELADLDSENREVALDYFPSSLQEIIADAAEAHFRRDASSWAGLLANAALALRAKCPENLPSDVSGALGFLAEIGASSESIESFRRAAVRPPAIDFNSPKI